MKKYIIKEALAYIFTGFYIAFLISAILDVTDIYGGSIGDMMGPKLFIGIATLPLIIFYFVSGVIKKDLHFIIFIIVFAVLFEGLIAQPLIKRNGMPILVLLIAMPLVHLAIFYIPRIFIKKIFGKRKKDKDL